MVWNSHDRRILRDLAQRVADIAALPVMDRRRSLWRQHNSLRPARPLMLIFPEGAWRELIPDASLTCENERARRIEQDLRRRIHTFEHFNDDTVIEGEWNEGPVLHDSGWGLEIKHHVSSQAHGAWGFDPVLVTEADINKITMPRITYDGDAHARNVESARELFGDILAVKDRGGSILSFHLTSLYAQWRGLEQTMVDFYERPEFVHRVMGLLEEGCRGILRQYQDLGVLALNNNNTYHSSGGNGFTDELPAPESEPHHPRLRDLWASAESQEMAPVSPEMHHEFVMQYESRLLDGFGLTGYGCCEDLTRKLQYVTSMPRMRRISVSPWADVDSCAEQLGNRFIFSWKPNPAYLCGDFSSERISSLVRHTLDAAERHHCILEIVLKDTHTVENQPVRFDQWTRICRDLIEERA